VNIRQSFSAKTLKSFKSVIDEGKDFSFVAVPIVVIESAGGESTQQTNDVTETIQASPTVHNNYHIIITSNDFIDAPIFSSENSSIATVDQQGNVTKVSDGITNIIVDVGGYVKKTSVNVASSAPTTQFISGEFVSGSLGEDAVDNIDSRIAGKTLEANGNIFTSQDHVNDVYIRNPDVWCNDIDLTCISPSNSSGNNKKAGTLITPRHVLIAAHYEYGVGTKVYFVSQDGNNTVYERTVVARIRHPDYSPYYPDLTICCLDSDLPENITPCKILPANYSNYLVEMTKGRAPVLRLDQEEKALIGDLWALSTRASMTTSTDSNRLEFYESIILYDSGNPAFLILDLGNGPELVVLTVWTWGGGGGGTFITPHIAALNQMIADSDTAAGNGGTGYTLTEADLSGFTDFS
jgi:hypothetical protein